MNPQLKELLENLNNHLIIYHRYIQPSRDLGDVINCISESIENE